MALPEHAPVQPAQRIASATTLSDADSLVDRRTAMHLTDVVGLVVEASLLFEQGHGQLRLALAALDNPRVARELARGPAGRVRQEAVSKVLASFMLVGDRAAA